MSSQCLNCNYTFIDESNCKCGLKYSQEDAVKNLDRITELETELTDRKLALSSAKIVMEYYHKNAGIHPMLNDFASEWLEINKIKDKNE